MSTGGGKDSSELIRALHEASLSLSVSLSQQYRKRERDRERDLITISHARMFLYGIGKVERKDKNENSGINVFYIIYKGVGLGWTGRGSEREGVKKIV